MCNRMDFAPPRRLQSILRHSDSGFAKPVGTDLALRRCMPAQDVTSPAATGGRDAGARIDQALPRVRSQPLPIIINAAANAGRAGSGLDALEEIFRAAGLDARVVPFGPGDDLKALAAEAAA